MTQNPENRTLTDKFMLRLPDGMRDRIKAAAEANNRSMNAEIVARLTASLEQDDFLRTPAPGGGLFGLRPDSDMVKELARQLADELAKGNK